MPISNPMDAPDETPTFAADGLLAVVHDTDRLAFVGTRKECETFLRELSEAEFKRHDLRYISDGQLWRMASFVL